MDDLGMLGRFIFGDSNKFRPVTARVEDCVLLGPEAQVFGVRPDGPANLNVWHATVHVDEMQFDAILFGDDGKEFISVYGHEVDRDFLDEALPPQSKLMRYLDERTKSNRESLGALYQVSYDEPRVDALMTVVKAYSLARGLSTEDDWPAL